MMKCWGVDGVPSQFCKYECLGEFEGPILKGDPVVIDTGDSHPVSCHPIRFNPGEEEQLKLLLDYLESKGVIEKIDSMTWSSKVKLVNERDKWRFTLNLILMNQLVKKSSYHSPHMGELRKKVRGGRVFCRFDLAKAFFQVPLEEASREKTAFQTPFGCYQFVSMPMGILWMLFIINRFFIS